jgi:hypothetical protein
MFYSTKKIQIAECLSFLTTRLETFTAHTQAYRSTHYATTLLLATARTELDAPPPPSPTKTKAAIGSPTRRRNSKTQTPVRPRNTTRRRSSAASFDDDTPAEQQLLRNLGIDLSPDLTSERAVAGILADALVERVGKLAMHIKSVQEGSEATIATHIHDASLSLKLLRDSLLSETKFGSVRLMDKEVEEAIEHLEGEVGGMSEMVGRVDLERLRERNIKREELVERWGGR